MKARVHVGGRDEDTVCHGHARSSPTRPSSRGRGKPDDDGSDCRRNAGGGSTVCGIAARDRDDDGRRRFVAHSGTPRQGGRGDLPSLDRCRADPDVKGAALVDADCLGHRDGRARTRRLRWRRQDRSGILLSSYRQLESAQVRQRLRERCDHRVGVGVGHRRARRLRRREDRPGGLPRRYGPMDDAPVECGLRDNRHIRSWHTN